MKHSHISYPTLPNSPLLSKRSTRLPFCSPYPKRMSSFHSLIDLHEQLCYLQCTFCNTILLVSVPCSSLLKSVTVRCGHCQGLLSVDMGKASFVPLHLLAPFEDVEKNHEERSNVPAGSHDDTRSFVRNGSGSEQEQEKDEEKEGDGEENLTSNIVVNKPPERRQRAPSAYNRFIKEEIQRIKTRDPLVSHKEAFSMAAKNVSLLFKRPEPSLPKNSKWAHSPRTQQRGDGESCGQKKARDGQADQISRYMDLA